MEPLDGNALAGDMYEQFGVEMTTATGACAHCGACSEIAELRVYSRAPGAVVRCRACDQVVMVVVDIRGVVQIDMRGFELHNPLSTR